MCLFLMKIAKFIYTWRKLFISIWSLLLIRTHNLRLEDNLISLRIPLCPPCSFPFTLIWWSRDPAYHQNTQLNTIIPDISLHTTTTLYIIPFLSPLQILSSPALRVSPTFPRRTDLKERVNQNCVLNVCIHTSAQNICKKE